MNREIKFRAWDRVEKEMVKVNILNWSYASGLEVNNSNVSLPATLMQYTGLKDKNGKDMFEGDIVRVENGSEGIIFAKVEWNDYGYMFKRADGQRWWFYQWPSSEVEVIGNIWEHPELLNN